MELYLDCNATTPLDPQVVKAMQPYWMERMGNPSSAHRQGRMARDAVDRARGEVAALLNVAPRQVIFTGSGTEANHLAIRGIAATIPVDTHSPPLVAVGATEHPSLLSAVERIEEEGWEVVQLPVSEDGLLAPEAFQLIEQRRPGLVSVMAANNETGVIQDLKPLITLAHQVGARVHVDGSQAVGKIPLDYTQLAADAMTISAHKIYGPKGVGALIVSPSLQPAPLLGGGGQERGLRSGTENVPAIVGFGVAAELARAGVEEYAEQMLQCRSRLEAGLEKIEGVEVVARGADRLPNTVMFLASAFAGETLLLQLDREGVAVSSGSACRSGKTGASHVLTAMGIPPDLAKNGVRVSLCRDITIEKIDIFLEILTATLDQQRGAINQAVWG